MTLIPPFLRSAQGKESTPEMDLSGTVVDVWHPDFTAGDPLFTKGDKIAAMLPAAHTLQTGTGALAQYVRFPARYAVHKPEDASFADAAAVMLAGLTARQLVLESGAAKGNRVLINAAAGGIGHLVVQMVRNAVGKDGLVVGICGASKGELIKSLGADEAIDYATHKDLPGYISSRFSSKPFDAVIDVRGHQDLYLASHNFLVPTGVYESVGIKPPTFWVPDFLCAVWAIKKNEYWPTSRWLLGAGRKWGACSMMSPTRQDRKDVIRMLERREIKVVRDSIWTFEEAPKAYKHLADGHAAGKILVKVDPTIGDDEC